MDELPAVFVDAYVALDMRLAWKPTDRLELAVVGQNLLDSSHIEYRDFSFPTLSTEVERGVYVQLTWRY